VSIVRRIAKNATVLLVAQGVTYFLAMLYMVYSARYLGPSNYGVIVFAMTFAGLFGVLADFGLQQLTVRELSRKNELDTKYLVYASVTRLILGSISYILLLLTISLMEYPDETRFMVYLIGISVMLSTFSQLIFSVFQAYEKMEFQAIGLVLQATLIFGGILLIIQQNMGTLYFGYVYILASSATFIYSIILTRALFFKKSCKVRMRYAGMDWSICVRILRAAVPFGLLAICSCVYYSMDSIILSYTQGNLAVGYYGVAYKIFQTLLFIPIVWAVSIFPVMVRLHANSPKSLVFATEKSFIYLTMIAVPMAVGLTLLAGQIIRITFGVAYMESVLVLQIISWAMVLLYMSISAAVYLQSIMQQVIYAKVLALCTILNVILNLIFIPMYSYIAASAVLLVTSLLQLTILLIVCWKLYQLFNVRRLWTAIIKIILSALIMGILVQCFNNINLFILIPAAICIYFLSIFVSGALSKEDLALFSRT